MAYVNAVFSAAGAAALSVDYSADEDDFMIMLCTQRYASVTGTPSGWTVLSYTATSQNGCTNDIFYRRATSSEPTSVTVNASSGSQEVMIIVCKGVDTTTAFDVTVTSRSSSSTNKGTAPAITPTNANTLIIYANMPHNVEMVPEPGPIKIGRIDNANYGAINAYYTYGQGASVAVTAHDFVYAPNSSNNPTIVTMALRDDGNNNRKGYVYKDNQPATLLSVMGRAGETGHLTSSTDIDVTATITTIQGITNNHRQQSQSGENYEIGIRSFGVSTNATKYDMASIGASRTPSVDLENEIVSLTIGGDLAMSKPYGVAGKHFILGDGTNYRIWRVDGTDTIPTSTDANLPILIEVDGGFESETDVGTVSASVLQALTHYVFATPAHNSYQSASCGFLYKHNTMEIVGGSTNFPASMATGVELARTSGLNTVANQVQQSGTQFYCLHKVSCGNGSQAVVWDSTNHSMEWPSAYDESAKKVQSQISANKLGFLIEATSSCVIDFTNSVFNLGNYHAFEIVSGTSTSATYTETGSIILNATPTLNDVGKALGDMTFSGCKEITKNSCDLSGGGVTIDGCVDTYAVTVTTEAEFNDLRNVAFTNNNYSIRITGNHGGDTWAGTGMTVSGGTGSYDIQYTGTGTLTIQMDSGSGFSTGRAEATVGTLTISAPTDDLTINSSESASQIHIYTTNTQTTLATTASGTQLVYTHSGQTVDITVLKDGFVPFRQTALTLSGDQTIDVSLVKSREYDSSHGLTYGSGNDGSIYDNRSVITGITQANPAVVTYSGADLWSNNDIISIQDVVGMTEVNGKRYTVANVNTGANTFELSGINSTAYTAYSSGGIVLSGLDINTFGPSARGIFSMCMEEFKSNSALYNLPFNLEMDGNGSLYLTNGVEGLADADIENMTAAGVGYLDVDATQTATWIGIESVGTIPGSNTGEWTADDATTVNDARATGKFDEIIKLHGDTDHGNFDNRANRVIMKMNINGYREQRVNVRELYGVSGNFTPNHFVVPIEPVAIEAATGDPGLTTDPVITDHGATPVSWNGKNFALTITDGATPNSGEDIIRHLNYFLRSANDTTLDGNDPFSWPEMVIEVVAGTSYETLYGYTEDAQTSTLKGVRVVKNDGTTAHPDFIRFQSDDGTYYTAPIVSNISITGMPTTGANIRLQIHNETAKTASAWAATTAYSLGDKVLRSTGLGSEQTAGLYFVCTTAGTSGGTEPTWDTVVNNTTADGTVTWTTYAILYYDDDPGAASYADSYTDLEEFADGDTYRIRFAEMDGGTSFKTYQTTGLVGSTGFTVPVTVTADSVYATNAIDGSSAAVTAKFTADYTNDELDLDADQDFAVTEAFAYYCYELTTSQGMYEFWDGVTAIDPANYRNNTANVSIYFDETAGFVKQTDSARWFRDDDTRPAIDPTTGGNGLEINWRNPVYGYDAGGGGFTASDRATLDAAATQASLNTVDTNVDSILTDTGTTIPAQISALNDLSAAQVNAECDTAISDASLATAASVATLATAASLATVDSNVDAIKAKTDQLTFTTANEVDANIQSVNDVVVDGTGAEGDEWGPA